MAGLLALLLGYGLYQLYFISTSEALRHAEDFLFRRMTATQLSEHGQYRFFYSTNRTAGLADAAIGDRYTNERSEQLSFGAFDAEIQPTLGIGMLINPTQWLQNEEIRFMGIHSVVQEKFVTGLQKAVEKSPHRAVLVVVNGYREAHESALRKTAFLGHVLDIDAPILLFDWPGDQGSSLRAYRRASRVASDSGTQLADTLQILIDEVQPEKIWVLANSMGAQVVVKAFNELYKKPQVADKQTEIKHVVLTAPDVDHEQFDDQFKREITAIADHLTVYVSSNDRALLASRLINRGARRGESTLSPDQFDEALRISHLMETDDKLITLVDVTPVNRTRNFHNFSLETPEFFDDLFLRLTNPNIPNSRPIYHIRTPDGVVYSVLTRGR